MLNFVWYHDIQLENMFNIYLDSKENIPIKILVPGKSVSSRKSEAEIMKNQGILNFVLAKSSDQSKAMGK